LVPCGFPSLSPLVHGGFRAGDLIVLGGDAGSGTTSLAMAMAFRATRAGSPTLMLSSEGSAARTFERALSAESRIALDVLRSGSLGDDARAALSTAATGLRAQSPTIKSLDYSGISGVRRSLDLAPHTRLLVIDGLESLLTDPAHRDDALAFAVLGCKRLALTQDIAVLLTAHLPLHDRTRRDLRPTLADFGVRGAVSTHADLVMALFREQLYHPEPALAGAAELHILKNRTGDGGYVDLYFDAPCLRFEDVIEA
jgi:replicative DNA helicase